MIYLFCGSLLSDEGSVYVYSPNSDYYGIDSFIFNVSDGENQIETTAEILVHSVNDVPEFVSNSIPNALENDEYTTEIEISDIDNGLQELELSIVTAPNWLELDGSTLSGIPGSNDAGTYDAGKFVIQILGAKAF